MQSRILLKSKVVSTFSLMYIASNHKQTYTVSHDSLFNSTQCLIIVTACLRYQSKCISVRFIYSFAMLQLNQKYSYMLDVSLHVFIKSAFKCKISGKVILPVKATSSAAVLWQDPRVEGSQEETRFASSDACEDV